MKQHGYSAEQLKVGVHMLGYVAHTTQEAADTFFPGYARAMTDVGKERGWPAMTRASFDAQRGPDGALLIGSRTKWSTRSSDTAKHWAGSPGSRSR
jgi:hypothetical protein